MEKFVKLEGCMKYKFDASHSEEHSPAVVAMVGHRYDIASKEFQFIALLRFVGVEYAVELP